MARTFDGGDDCLYVNQAVADNNLYSFSCWFKPSNVTGIHTLVSIGDWSHDYWSVLSARGDQADKVWAHTYAAGSTYAISSTAFVANVWQHACAVFNGQSERRVYLNGGSKGTTTGTRDLSQPDTTSVGTAYVAGGGDGSINGAIAEVGIWNIALTDAEAAILATGVRPIFVRPEGLVTYLPLIRDDDEDLVGGLSFSEDGAGISIVADHPPMIYGAGVSSF